MLNEMQNDLLKELVNIFIGKAAKQLSEITNQKVLLNVPRIEIVDLHDDALSALKKIDPFKPGYVVSSSMEFGSDFSGEAMLVFPSHNAKSLVDVCIGDFDSFNQLDNSGLTVNDLDVLREISNVILNIMIGEFGNLLNIKLNFSLPKTELVLISSEEKIDFLNTDMTMFLLYTNFTLEEAQITGAILFTFGITSLEKLIIKIDEMIDEIT